MATTINDLRAVFSSPVGQSVLLWILHEHHVFSANLKTQEEITLHNWGMKLLALIGPKDTKRSVEGYIKMAMMEQNKNSEKEI